MPDLEIVASDSDTASLGIGWIPGEEAYLMHEDRQGNKNCIVLQKDEAQQLIAALSSFVAGWDRHASDCSLHRSPAYPIEACDCAIPRSPQVGEDVRHD